MLRPQPGQRGTRCPQPADARRQRATAAGVRAAFRGAASRVEGQLDVLRVLTPGGPQGSFTMASS